MECPPGQIIADNLLWNPSLCLSRNPQGTRVRRKDRHMVIGDHDVRDAGWRKPIQNYQVRGTGKNYKGRGFDSLVCENKCGSQGLPGQVSA